MVNSGPLPARRRHLGRAAAIAGVALLGLLAPTVAAADPASTWFTVDLHVHSAVSADAVPDLDILAQNARASGIDAVFLTDHNQASDFSVSARTANNAFFNSPAHDDLTRWSAVGAGVAEVGSPVNSGTMALHLPSADGGERYVWSARGPNFVPGTGTNSTTFSFYPTQWPLPAGASIYVSASFGGDVTIEGAKPGPVGYTPKDSGVPGVPAACKSVVFVWFLGTDPNKSNPGRYQPTAASCGAGNIPPVVVKPFPIAAKCHNPTLGPITPNVWNTCTLGLGADVATLSSSDRPYDYLGLTDLKVAAFGATGDVYVDDYSTTKALPPLSTVDSRAGAEFAARNALLPAIAARSGLALFPAIEEGTNEHAQRFDFGISTAAQFSTYCAPDPSCSYFSGVAGLASTAAAGYPGQLNHPGVAGGVTDAEVIGLCSNGLAPACGGDTMEVRQRNMLNDWDQILAAGVPLVGTWGTDNHTGQWSGQSLENHLYAPSLGRDDLLAALFEGRAYMSLLGVRTARTSLLLNLDATSPAPYPARYPLYVPPGTSVPVHAASAAIPARDVVRWIVNGAVVATAAPTADNSYEETRAIPITGSSTYARVEVGPSSDPTADPDGASEAIMIRPTAGLPAGMRYAVSSVQAAAGAPAWSTVYTKGIVASSFDAVTQTLGLTLADRPGSLVTVQVATAVAPSVVSLNGNPVAQAGSAAEFDAATGASWSYQAGQLAVKAPAASAADALAIRFAPLSAVGTGLQQLALANLRVSARTVRAGSPVDVSGVAPTLPAGATMTVRLVPAAHLKAVEARIVVGAGGGFTVRLRPSRSGRLAIDWAGNGAFLPATFDAGPVAVRGYVVLLRATPRCTRGAAPIRVGALLRCPRPGARLLLSVRGRGGPLLGYASVRVSYKAGRRWLPLCAFRPRRPTFAVACRTKRLPAATRIRARIVATARGAFVAATSRAVRLHR